MLIECLYNCQRDSVTIGVTILLTCHIVTLFHTQTHKSLLSITRPIQSSSTNTTKIHAFTKIKKKSIINVALLISVALLILNG